MATRNENQAQIQTQIHNDQIIFYDIASAPPHRTFAPNPWKTRYALNHTRLPYHTVPTDLPSIHSLRTRLSVPANRTLPDNTPYHTLPLITDPATGEHIGDSFEIALYLDRKVASQENSEEGRRLFRPSTTGLTASFNARVDAIFTQHVALIAANMPFPEESKTKIYQIFASRARLMPINPPNNPSPSSAPGNDSAPWKSFQNSLSELAKSYSHVGGTTDSVWRSGGTAEEQKQRNGREGQPQGPWLDGKEGEEPVYADFIVGGWLAMAEACMGAEDWERVRAWDGGLWGRVHDALGPWREMK
jgi:hypothetical protein